MGWITHMNLRKSLFTLTFITLSAAVALSIASFFGCLKLRSIIAPQGIVINPHTSPVTMAELPAPSEHAAVLANVLEILQFVLPVLFFITALILTSCLFYRLKLKSPISLLTDSADRIMANDLDFTIASSSSDELGQLCRAFETMRQALLANTQELWRQNEERRRLNAAFSHDLRNPVTVLKGSVKFARQCVPDDRLSKDQLLETLARMEDYTDRIARYVEVMSSIQQLEQLPLQIGAMEWAVLSHELEHTVQLIAANTKIQVVFKQNAFKRQLLLDKSVIFQTAENLIANALRFAVSKIIMSCSVSQRQLILSVSDDGSGFPDALLKNGIRPFQKGTENMGHFGMGLYTCSVLCQKHGGSLQIENTEQGALVTARFEIKSV